jgi:hypothetical protein
MFSIKITLNILFVGLFVSTACSPTSTGTIVIPSPTATIARVWPTPSSPGDPLTWRDMKVIFDQAEITNSFTNEFGSQRVPSAGQNFLWIHVALENVGKDEVLLPELENFSVLYAESEFKPIYGHRQGYVDYTNVGTALFPGQEIDAWLRFDIPNTAELKDLLFVFLPTSAQVGVSPSSPNYPYAENKPTFVWKCEPSR